MKKSVNVDRRRCWAALILIGVLLVNGLITAPIAQAAPAGLTTIASCALDKAITAANQGSTAGTGCTFSGTGQPYVFILSANLSLSTELPAITSKLIITTDGNNVVIDQTSADASFVFNVGQTGNLTLKAIRVTNTGGNSDGIDVDTGGLFAMVDSTLDSLIFGISSSGTVTVNNSTISNSALGFWIAGGSATMVNSTVVGNLGDGIYIDQGANLTISDSTLANNGGSGLDVDGAVVVVSTIIAQNTSFGCLVRIGQITSHGYNIESPGNTCNLGATGDRARIPPLGTGGLNLDPILAQNGPQPRPHTRALLSGSVAIDAIPTTSGLCPPNGVSVDERGNVRAGQVRAGDQRGGLACDVGAYEFDSTEILSATTLRDFGAQAQPSATGLWPATLLLALSGTWLVARHRRA